MREHGYYWVRITDRDGPSWLVGNYNNEGWLVHCYIGRVEDEWFDEIDERRIVRGE